MRNRIPTRPGRPATKADSAAIKRELIARGLTYADVARVAGTGWFMIYAVINRRKTSSVVMGALDRLGVLRAA